MHKNFIFLWIDTALLDELKSAVSCKGIVKVKMCAFQSSFVL